MTNSAERLLPLNADIREYPLVSIEIEVKVALVDSDGFRRAEVQIDSPAGASYDPRRPLDVQFVGPATDAAVEAAEALAPLAARLVLGS